MGSIQASGSIDLLAVASFSKESVWVALVQIFILVAALLLGNLLRRVIPFLRKSLIPSALIGGTIVLLCRFVCCVCDLYSHFVSHEDI